MTMAVSARLWCIEFDGDSFINEEDDAISAQLIGRHFMTSADESVYKALFLITKAF